MHKLHVTCPRCGTEADLHLQEEAHLVLLRCGHCKAALLHLNGETVAVDEMEFDTLRAQQLKAVQGFLQLQEPNAGAMREIRAPREGPVRVEAWKPREVEPKQVEPGPKHDRPQQRDLPLRGDDLLDLRILLETTGDVQDFLDRL
jgi:hypothetical protein